MRLHVHAAVDPPDLTGDVAGGVRGEEVHDAGDVVPGGPAVGDAAVLFTARQQRGGDTLETALAAKLTAVVDDYDLAAMQGLAEGRPHRAFDPPGVVVDDDNNNK